MNQQEVEGRYLRLKQELAEAYASSAWDSPHIDRLARELFEIDRIAKNQDTETQPLQAPCQNGACWSTPWKFSDQSSVGT
jgi:hypothetical protein